MIRNMAVAERYMSVYSCILVWIALARHPHYRAIGIVGALTARVFEVRAGVVTLWYAESF